MLGGGCGVRSCENIVKVFLEMIRKAGAKKSEVHDFLRRCVFICLEWISICKKCEANCTIKVQALSYRE